jgi:hypothetical protein
MLTGQGMIVDAVIGNVRSLSEKDTQRARWVQIQHQSTATATLLNPCGTPQFQSRWKSKSNHFPHEEYSFDDEDIISCGSSDDSYLDVEETGDYLIFTFDDSNALDGECPLDE